ncbi:protein decapentaplegic-like [Ptychodera flava]|uniref:protein decapentaplegic-like n=1 Tax=Ptychodera flava TaxID=63121 RepID=UPI00396A6F58
MIYMGIKRRSLHLARKANRIIGISPSKIVWTEHENAVEISFDVGFANNLLQVLGADFFVQLRRNAEKDVKERHVNVTLSVYRRGVFSELDSNRVITEASFSGKHRRFSTFDISNEVNETANEKSNQTVSMKVYLQGLTSYHGDNLSPKSLLDYFYLSSQDRETPMVLVYLKKLPGYPDGLSSIMLTHMLKETRQPENMAETDISVDKETRLRRSNKRLTSGEDVSVTERPPLNHLSCRRHDYRIHFARHFKKGWLLFPDYVDARICSGTCVFPLTEHMNITNHAVLLAIVRSSGGGDESTPCCVPTSLRPMSVVYVDDDGSVVNDIAENMIVDSCGCR